MAGKKCLIRATISIDKDDYAAMGQLAERVDVSAAWLIRQAIRDFLERHGKNGQPELALCLADKQRH